MKNIYFKGLTLAMVFSLTLTSCNKDAKVLETSKQVDTKPTSTVMDTGLSSALDANSNVQSVNLANSETYVSTDKEAKKILVEAPQTPNQVSSDKKAEDRELKGIEEMALYRKGIAKNMDEKEPTYEAGYLLKEFKKAKKRVKQLDNARFQPIATEFIERGPGNVPGRARGILINANNPDNWFIGTAGGGIWETENAGTTWSSTTDNYIPNLATTTLTSSTITSDVIFAGTGEPYGNLDAIRGSGIVKSSDGGTTWEFLAGTEIMGSVARIVAHPTDINTVLAATNDGVYKTNDGGITWNKKLNGNYFQDLTYEPNNFSTLYASYNNDGIYKSVDEGENWTKVFEPADFEDSDHEIKRMEIDVSPANPNHVVIAAYATSKSAYYFSKDAGATFTALTAKVGSDGNILSSQGWYDNALAFHPFDENVFYSGGVYLAKVTVDFNTNKFTTFPIAGGYNDVPKQINRYVHVDMQNIVYQINPSNPAEFRLILTNDGGVYYTGYKTDPGTTEGDWSNDAINMNTTQFYGADKKNGEDKYVAGAQDNGSWYSLTANPTTSSSYEFVWGGDGFKSLWNYGDTSKVMVSSQYNNIARIAYPTGVSTSIRHKDYGSGTSPFYSKISNVNNNPNVVFSPSKNGVWRTIDFGDNWELTTITNDWSGGSAPSYLEVAASVANPNVVWAGCAMTESYPYAIHYSTDNGQSFTPSTNFVDPRNGYALNSFISGLATSSINENRAYVLFSKNNGPKVLRTNDMGQTWEDISGYTLNQDRGFPNVAIHALLEMPFDENIIWVGTDIGIFETQDGGQTWHILEDFIPVSVWDLKYVNDEIVISTHGRGIWTATVPELNNFELPTYIVSPVVEKVRQAGIYDMRAVIDYSYESTVITAVDIYVDDVLVGTVDSGLQPNTTLTYTTSQTFPEGEHKVKIIGKYNTNKETVYGSKTGSFIEFNPATKEININPFDSTDIYIPSNKDFVIDTLGGKFDYNVLNNVGHNYDGASTYTTYLKDPFLVSNIHNTLTLNQIVATENNYDFAYVEASTDLNDWVVVGKFDEGDHTEWQSITATSIDETKLKDSHINLANYFNSGDEIAIRLRLVSDPFVERFGWVIKSIINEGNLAVEDVVVLENDETAKIAPNPVSKNINIFLSNRTLQNVHVDIFDMTGRLIQSHDLQSTTGGSISLPFKKVKAGNYIAVIKTDDFNKTIKFIKK